MACRSQRPAHKEYVIPDPVAKQQALTRHHRLLLIGFCAAVLLPPHPAAGAPVELRVDSAVAKAGYFRLSWQAAGDVIVQEDTSPVFATPRVVYRGPDNARVLSGKPDGEWYYRARTAGRGGAFGDVLEVTVRHHPLERALAFFALGALVFLTTLAAIVRGARAA
jgi:hypothetical protein